MEIEKAEDQNLQADADNINSSAPVAEDKPAAIQEPKEPNYIPLRDNLIVQSAGKSGWQISDIWRDIRVDDFCS